MLGGEWKNSGNSVASRAGNAGTNEGTSAGATTGIATTTGSALTKCFKGAVVQVLVIGAGRLQHPCGAFCGTESSSWGQEKQFPQKSAATTNAANSELEKARIQQ